MKNKSKHGGARQGAGSHRRMIALGNTLIFESNDGMPPLEMTVIEKTKDHAVLVDKLGTQYRVRIKEREEDSPDLGEAEDVTGDERGVVAWSPENPDVVDLRGAGPVVRNDVLHLVRFSRALRGMDPDGFTILED